MGTAVGWTELVGRLRQRRRFRPGRGDTGVPAADHLRITATGSPLASSRWGSTAKAAVRSVGDYDHDDPDRRWRGTRGRSGAFIGRNDAGVCRQRTAGADTG